MVKRPGQSLGRVVLDFGGVHRGIQYTASYLIKGEETSWRATFRRGDETIATRVMRRDCRSKLELPEATRVRVDRGRMLSMVPRRARTARRQPARRWLRFPGTSASLDGQIGTGRALRKCVRSGKPAL